MLEALFRIADSAGIIHRRTDIEVPVRVVDRYTPTTPRPATQPAPTLLDQVTGCVTQDQLVKDSPAEFEPADTLAAAAAAQHRCNMVAITASGERYDDQYCQNLPRGHNGPCEPNPLPARMALEWHRAMEYSIAQRKRLAPVPS